MFMEFGGSYNRDSEAVQRMANSDTLPAQESNTGGDNYRGEVQYRSVTMGELHTESSTARTTSKKYFTNWCENLWELNLVTRKQMLEASRDCEKSAGGGPK